jgi:A/G-specific adenine glycosylase
LKRAAKNPPETAPRPIADDALGDGFADALLAWYRLAKRPLPWRDRQDDPYAVWVSEIMLQQTTVATVIPYYHRWMAAFPTVDALASASLDDVLRHWSGLGYYARARNMKRAAETIVAAYDGRFPSSVDALLTIPGVGRYTAGAISSIAFNQPAPIVDANVIRVLSRLRGIAEDADSAPVRERLWRIAEQSIPPDDARDYNQALMELGALICSPAAPRCAACPVAAYCEARKSGDPTGYPLRAKKTAWVNVTDCAVALERDGRLLMIRRPESGLWGGLWELPRATMQEGEAHDGCARRALSDAGVAAAIGGSFGIWKHTVMNRRITLYGFRAGTPSSSSVGIGSQTETRWATPLEIAKLPLSSPQEALLRIWSENRHQTALTL